MYYNGQIVYDLDAKKPVKIDDAWDLTIGRTTCFVAWEGLGGKARNGEWCTVVRTALPSSVEEAQQDLDRGLIVPAPVSDTHCWKCRNWKSNCRLSYKWLPHQQCSEHEASEKWYQEHEAR
jgi:hypothetical protein